MKDEINRRLIGFIEKNPTAFHVVRSVAEELSRNGYTELKESGSWKLVPGGGYYVCRNDSSIIAFRIGNSTENLSFRIAASHTDSPAFKIKENAELVTGKKYIRLNTEGYGGMICSTWMDRPLSVAGRLIVKAEDGSISGVPVMLDRDLCVIPSVAIHMNRDVNEGTPLNKQVDMLPLFGSEEGENLLKKLLADEAGVSPDRILGSDLFLYSRQKGTVWGRDGEFLSCCRLDDQQCVFASMTAMLEAKNDRAVNVLACFDNEEVGSLTGQGADSTFLEDTLKRISSALGKSDAEYGRALASSFMLSADNAHAVHPNHPEYSDENNRVYMNEGVVVKSHAGQSYTSDGISIAIVRELASRAGVPLQYFSNRSDKKGGSTLGNISMAHVSVHCADIGIAQLAMHSSYETAGAKDTEYMIRLICALYESSTEETEHGWKIVFS